MKKLKLITLACCLMALAFAISGCGKETPKGNDSTTKTDTVKQTATFVGSATCNGCHEKANVVKTKHNGSFKALSSYQLESPAGTVTVFDGAATSPNTISTKIDLSKALGVMMDTYVVAEIPKEAGFAKQYYRVAHIVKAGDKWKLEAASKVAGKEDWSAGDYSCGKCHSPGIGAPGKADLTITCEACHGAGSEHVAANTPELKRATMKQPDSETCLNCHRSNPSKDAKTGVVTANTHYGTRDYTVSKHASNSQTNGCFTCHGVHKPNANGLLLKNDNPNDICMSCHAEKKYDVKTVMWKNPTDARGHFTADHSFGALKYEDLGDNPATPAIEITKQPALDILKAKLPEMFK